MRVSDVQAAVCEYYGLKRVQMLEKRGPNSVAWPRMIGMYICHHEYGIGVAAVGRGFGKHHTTVIYAVSRIGEMRRSRREINAVIETIVRELGA